MSPRYFPQYWHQSRPFAKGLYSAMAGAAQTGGVKAASSVLFSSIHAAAVKAGLSPQAMMRDGLLAREAMGAQTLAQWELDGATVWDYAPSLVEALRLSDPGDLRLDDLLPYIDKGVYFHFGPQADWLLDEQAPVEGIVALAPAEGHWRVMLVGRSALPWTARTPSCFQMLKFRLSDMGSLPFSEAVDAAVRLDVEDIEQAIEVMAGAPEELGGPEAGHALKERQVRHAPLYTEVLRLLGGAIAYVQAYPDDVQTNWQDGTPEKWILKSQAPGKEGPRAQSKLHAMGYWRVRRIGDQFEAADQAARHSGARIAHWRRGHWRNQAHGPHMSLRKLIWIRPVRVLGTAASEGSDSEESASRH